MLYLAGGILFWKRKEKYLFQITNFHSIDLTALSQVFLWKYYLLITLLRNIFIKLHSDLSVGVHLKNSLWSVTVKLLIDNDLHLVLIIHILGSVQIAVQIEEEKQENEVSPDLMSDKDVSTVMKSEPGKEYIEMREIGKIENSGRYSQYL